nr:unnamed protein product [Naegleria fowleri]
MTSINDIDAVMASSRLEFPFNHLNSNITGPYNSSMYVGDCLKIDPDGRPYISWMYDVMGECVHSGLEQASFYVGLLSLVLYLFGGIPQVITTFRKGHADGLSVVTLAQWMIADGSNLIGAALTGQLFTQILLAAYFVLMDFILIGQYIFYNSRKLWRKHVQKKKDFGSPSSSSKPTHDGLQEIITVTDKLHSETLDEHPFEITDVTKRKEVLEGIHISGDVSARVGVGASVGASALMPAHLHYQAEDEESSSDTNSPITGENVQVDFEVPNPRTTTTVHHPEITTTVELSRQSHQSTSSTSQTSTLPQFPTSDSENTSNNASNTKLYSFSTFFIVFTILIILSCSMYQFSTSFKQTIDTIQPLHRKIGRKLLSTTDVSEIVQDSSSTQKDHNAREFPPQKPYAIVGYVIGCVSTVCYMGSRIAQIINNFRRGSTEGMNPVLFICSVVGNLFYSLSIFLFSIDSSYLCSKIPWLTSSLGNQFLDYTILSQFVFYTYFKKKKRNSKDKDIEMLTTNTDVAKIYAPINQEDHDLAKDATSVKQ